LVNQAVQSSAVPGASSSSTAALTDEGIDYQLLAAGIYLTMILLLTARLIKQLYILRSMISRGEISYRSKVRIVKVPGLKSSFSFFTSVFIGSSMEESEAVHILNHEEVHVSQRHWFDLLLAEIIKTIQWINPFAWIYAAQVRQNHEFLADEAALKKTSDPGLYRVVLLNEIFNSRILPISNSFSYSNSKKRFVMMDKIIFSPYRKLKLLVIIPVAAIIFYAFAIPEYQYVAPADNSEFIDKVSGLQKTVSGIILNEEEKPMAGVAITIAGWKEPVVTGGTGKFSLSGIPENEKLVFAYPGYKTLSLDPDYSREMVLRMVKDPDAKPTDLKIVPPPATTPGETAEAGPLWVVDGVIREKKEWIDPNTINTVSVLKGESATAVFGEKGKNGVIVVTLKK
jgi:bla regulator protein blaR1